LLFGCFIAAGTAHGQTLDHCGSGFEIPVGVTTGHAADVDGDGVLDVVVASAAGTVSVWLGSLTVSSYSAAQSDDVVLDGSTTIHDIHVEDMNGDGHADLIAANRTFINVALGGGDGTFGAVTSIECEVCTIDLGDVDGDSALDLLSVSNEEAVVFLNDGTGLLTTSRVFRPSGSLFYNGAFVDANLDGRLDVHLQEYETFFFYNSSSYMHLGDGTGRFSGDSSGPSFDGFVSHWMYNDMNDDGVEDLVLVHDGKAEVWLGASAGPWISHGYWVGLTEASSTSICSGFCTSAVVEDMSGDGYPDLLTTAWANPGFSIQIAYGNGDGTLSPGPTMHHAHGEYALSADFNLDGRSDLMVVGNGATHIGTPPCP